MTSKPNNNFNFQCFVCTFQCRDVENFTRHLDDAHSRYTYYWCKTCGKVSSKRELYIEHVKEQNCPEVFNNPCGFNNCNFSDQDPQRLLYHFKNNHGGPSLLPCKYCKRIFTIPLNLVLHCQSECCNRPTVPPGEPSNQAAQSDTPPNVDNRSSRQVPVASHSRSSNPAPDSTSTTQVKNFVKNTYVNNNKTVSCTNKNNKIKDTFSDIPKHKSLFNISDSDPDDPSYQPSHFDSHKPQRSVQSKVVSSHKKQSRKRNSEASNLKCAKKIKQTASDSTQVGKDLETNTPMFLSWSSWEAKIASFKSPDTLQELLLPANICNFFKCMATACSFSTNVDTEFLSHITSQHPREVQVCCYCLKKMSTCDLLLKHMLTEHIKRKYQCACLFRACQKKHVRFHQMAMHMHEQIIAPFRCKEIINSIDTSNIEPNEINPRVSKSYRCSRCTFSTVMIKLFKDHLSSEHAETKVFNCISCEYETDKIEDFVLHFNEHGLYTNECPYCEFGSEDSNDVVQHLCMNHADHQIAISNRVAEPSDEESDSESKTIQPNLNRDTYSEKVLPQSDVQCEEKMTTLMNHLSPEQDQAPVKPTLSPKMPTLKPFDALPMPSNVSSIAVVEACLPKPATGSTSLTSMDTLNMAEPDDKWMECDTDVAEMSDPLIIAEPDPQFMDRLTDNGETSDSLNLAEPDTKSLDGETDDLLNTTDPDVKSINDDAETSDKSEQTSVSDLDKNMGVNSFTDVQDECPPRSIFNGHQESLIENECSNESICSVATEKNYACSDSNPTKFDSKEILKDDMVHNLQDYPSEGVLCNKGFCTPLQLKEHIIHSDCNETKFCDEVGGSVETVISHPSPRGNSLCEYVSDKSGENYLQENFNEDSSENFCHGDFSGYSREKLPLDDFSDNSREKLPHGDFSDNLRESSPQNHLSGHSLDNSPHDNLSDNSHGEHETPANEGGSWSTKEQTSQEQTRSKKFSNKNYSGDIIFSKQPVVLLETMKVSRSRGDSVSSGYSKPATASTSSTSRDTLDIADIIAGNSSTPDTISEATSTTSDTGVTEPYFSNYGKRPAPFDWSSITLLHKIHNTSQYARLNGIYYEAYYKKKMRIVLDDCMLGHPS